MELSGSWVVEPKRQAELPEAEPGDLAIARRIWPLLLVAAFSWLPSTALALLLVPIAQGLEASVAVVGGMRGLGGLTALAAGVVVVPLVDRYSRRGSIALSLLVIALATVAPIVAGVPGLALYAVALGAAQAVLLPAVQAAAADEGDPRTRTRAASLVSACMALGPMISGVVLTIPVAVFGWQGAFVMMAGFSVLLALLSVVALSPRPPSGVAGLRYLETFPLILASPGAGALLLGATLRACGWFSMTAYLSALLADRFGLDTVQVGLVWTGNAVLIFSSNLIAGRIAAGGARRSELVLIAALALMVVVGPISYLATALPLALAATWAFAFGNGATGAGTTSLLVSRFVRLRGPMLGFSAAGTNLGVFAGAAFGALALAAFDYPGVAAVVGVLLLFAEAASIAAARAFRRQPAPEPPPTY